MSTDMQSEALRQRVHNAVSELTRASRPEVREIAEEVANGRYRPSDFLHSSGYSEFFHECVTTLQTMDPAELQALMDTDENLAEEQAADTTADAHEHPQDPDDEDDEDFFQRSFIR